jgi:hypothetical protein
MASGYSFMHLSRQVTVTRGKFFSHGLANFFIQAIKLKDVRQELISCRWNKAENTSIPWIDSADCLALATKPEWANTHPTSAARIPIPAFCDEVVALLKIWNRLCKINFKQHARIAVSGTIKDCPHNAFVPSFAMVIEKAFAASLQRDSSRSPKSHQA